MFLQALYTRCFVQMIVSVFVFFHCLKLFLGKQNETPRTANVHPSVGVPLVFNHSVLIRNLCSNRGRNPQTTLLTYMDTGFMVPSLSPLQEESRPKPVNVLSIFAGHDASIAISIDGQVQCVLELERLFGERYYNLMGFLEQEEKRGSDCLSVSCL